MENPAIVIAKLRMLATTQVTDDAWLSAASEALEFDAAKLTVKHWMELLDPVQHGTVEKITVGGQEGLCWNRPDGGMPLFMNTDVPEHVILTRYLLFSNLITALKNDNQASFMKVGLIGWNKCKIYFNGNEVTGILSADAILNTVEYHITDRSGGLVLSEDKSSVETQKLSGIVRIVMQETIQTFF